MPETTKPSYHGKLWEEFTKADLEAFRESWVKDYICETDVNQEIAEIYFEDYCGQEGWTRRNERICMEREIQKRELRASAKITHFPMGPKKLS